LQIAAAKATSLENARQQVPAAAVMTRWVLRTGCAVLSVCTAACQQQLRQQQQQQQQQLTTLSGSREPCGTLDITQFGAVVMGRNGSNSAAAEANAVAINRTLAAAAEMGPGCTVLIPPGRFLSYGGIVGAGLRDTVIRIDGTLVAEFSTTQWPGCPQKCKSFLQLTGAQNITITSSVHFPPSFPTVPRAGDDLQPVHPLRTAGGLIDGQGEQWWAWKLLTGHKCPSPLIAVQESQGVLLEQLQLLNAPSFHVRTVTTVDAEVRFIDIYVDRKAQVQLRPSRLVAALWLRPGTSS
jgi:hypothetical protein